MTAKFTVFFAAAALWSVSALANPAADATSASVRQALGRDLTTAESNLIQARVEQLVDQASEAKVQLAAETAAADPTVRDYFVCVGGKAAYGINGREGLKCVNLFNAKSVTVTFNGESSATPLTGLGANQYVGANAGLAANLGFMVVDHPAGQAIDGGYGFNTQSKHLTGGVVNYTWGLTGFLYGLFFKNGSTVFIGAWQPGLAAFEAGMADIRIIAEN